MYKHTGNCNYIDHSKSLNITYKFLKNNPKERVNFLSIGKRISLFSTILLFIKLATLYTPCYNLYQQ